MSNRCWKEVESRQYPSTAKSAERKEESSDIWENRRKKDLKYVKVIGRKFLQLPKGGREEITKEQKEGEKT